MKLSTMKKVITVGLLWLAAISFSPKSVSAVSLIGPDPYLSFSDSPFNGLSFAGYFYLENFEDLNLNTPGVTALGDDLIVMDWGVSNDSVDADDGNIDGSGNNGRAMWAWGNPGITFLFNAAVLGHLPTHVGIVWTDGINPITFQAFDATDVSLGTLGGNHADALFYGTAAEDRFYGVIHEGGISKIIISNGMPAGIEVDHLQYGSVIPEPSSILLLGLGLLGLARLKLRRKKWQR